jgi:hypothetical protein
MMRATILIGVLALSGCGDTPASLGITGPGAPPPPAPAIDDTTVGVPGIPDTGGGGYGSGLGPAPASGRYFNYN